MATTMQCHEVPGGTLMVVLSTGHELTETERRELDAIEGSIRALARPGESPWSWEGQLDLEAVISAV